MLSLDDKLYDILCPDIDGPINSVEQIEAAVAQIKQAFMDAGYRTSDVVNKANKMAEDMKRILEDSQKTLNNLKTVKAYIYTDKSQTVAEGVMTGQEWYDRLTAEIGDITPETARQILESHGAAGIYTYVIEAARRASGINEKETN